MTFAIEVDGLSKWYPLRPNPASQFWRALTGTLHQPVVSDKRQPLPPSDALMALHPMSFKLAKGSVLGIIGKNGAGKSTLLQLLSRTLEPSAGRIETHGRVAALLELGAGFNPEFTGLENVHLNAALLGLSAAQIRERLESILAFADIGDFVKRPVKTYSSGMFVRLAFAVAVCVEPEILIVDEALSVGDGQFARKSFQRIMDLKDSGTTILFCSHSLYQVEALCDQALWLDRGFIKQFGNPGDVIAAYTQFLESGQATAHPSHFGMSIHEPENPSPKQHDDHSLAQTIKAEAATESTTSSVPALARILAVNAWFEGRAIDFRNESDRRLMIMGSNRRLELEVVFRTSNSSQHRAASEGLVDVQSKPLQVGLDWETPTVAVTLTTAAGQCLSAVSTLHCPESIIIDQTGLGRVGLVFPSLPLRRGIFRLDVLLGCERGLQLYDHGIGVLTLDARAQAAEQGLVDLEHRWQAPSQALV
jgi:lipopolysaccharide transport system ATP-binding protein